MPKRVYAVHGVLVLVFLVVPAPGICDTSTTTTTIQRYNALNVAFACLFRESYDPDSPPL